MNDRNLLLEAGITFDGGQLLDIHLGAVATCCQPIHERTFGAWGQVLAQNESHRTEGKRAILSPQFALNANGAMPGMGQSVVNNCLSIGIVDAPVMLFRRTAVVVAVMAFDPLSYGCDGRVELGGQFRVAKLASCVQTLNLFPLADCKSRVLMKVHQVHS